MVDGCRPTPHIMAKRTIRPILPFVLIVVLVTGITVGWYSFVHIICMAILTGSRELSYGMWRIG